MKYIKYIWILSWLLIAVTIAKAQPPIYLVPLNNSIFEGDTVAVDVILGTSSQPIDSINTINISIDIDTAHLAFFRVTYTNYPNNFFGTETIDYDYSIDTTVNSTLKINYSLKTKSNASGFKKLGVFELIVEDDVPGVYNSTYKIIDVNAQTAYGFNVSLTPLETTVLLNDKTLQGVPKSIWTEKLSLYPNPTRDIININTTDIIVHSTELYDIAGNVVLTTNATTIDCSSLDDGVYIIVVHTDLGMIIHKLIKSD